MQGGEPSAVHGAMRCLVLVSEEITDNQVRCCVCVYVCVCVCVCVCVYVCLVLVSEEITDNQVLLSLKYEPASEPLHISVK